MTAFVEADCELQGDDTEKDLVEDLMNKIYGPYRAKFGQSLDTFWVSFLAPCFKRFLEKFWGNFERILGCILAPMLQGHGGLFALAHFIYIYL